MALIKLLKSIFNALSNLKTGTKAKFFLLSKLITHKLDLNKIFHFTKHHAKHHITKGGHHIKKHHKKYIGFSGSAFTAYLILFKLAAMKAIGLKIIIIILTSLGIYNTGLEQHVSASNNTGDSTIVFTKSGNNQLDAIINTNISTLNIITSNLSGKETHNQLFDESLLFMSNFDNIQTLNETRENLEETSQSIQDLKGKNKKKVEPNIGIIRDISLLNNTGTVEGATRTTGGKHNGAYIFNGDDLITIKNIQQDKDLYKSGLTLSTWIKLTGDQNYTTLIEKNSEYSLELYPYDKGDSFRLTFNINTPKKNDLSLSRDQRITNHKNRYHIIATYDGNLMKLYVDGKLITQKEVTGTIKSHSKGNLNIGKDFNGTIDEIKIYKRALSTTEIGNLYYSNLSKTDLEQRRFINNFSGNLQDKTNIIGLQINDLNGNESKKYIDDQNNVNEDLILSGNILTGDINTGNTLSGNTLTGDINTGNTLSGNILSGDILTGDILSGNILSGNILSGDILTGDVNTGNILTGDVNTGNILTGDVLTGNILSGDILTGDILSGDILTGDVLTGDILTGDINTGNNLSGDILTGDVLTGDILSGNILSGGINTGTLLSGDILSGNTLSGNVNTGNILSGDVLTGDINTGSMISETSGNLLENSNLISINEINEQLFEGQINTDIQTLKFIFQNTGDQIQTQNLYDNRLLLMSNFNNQETQENNNIKSGFVSDLSTNNNSGTINGAQISSGGVFNTAILFDGNDEIKYTNIQQNSDTFNSGLTISTWIKMPGDQKYSTLVAKTSEYGLKLYPYENGESFRLSFNLYHPTRDDLSLSRDQRITNHDDRYHVVATYDNTYMKLYIDGILITQKETSGTIKSHTKGNLTIGKNFNGLMDELQIYNYALSSKEIELISKSALSKINNNKRELKTILSGSLFNNTQLIGVETKNNSGITHNQYLKLNQEIIKTGTNLSGTVSSGNIFTGEIVTGSLLIELNEVQENVVEADIDSSVQKISIISHDANNNKKTFNIYDERLLLMSNFDTHYNLQTGDYDSGKAYDLSIYNNSGFIDGATIQNNGKVNSSFFFDGNDQIKYTNIEQSRNTYNSGLTLSTRIQLSGGNTQSTIINKNSEYLLKIQPYENGETFKVSFNLYHPSRDDLSISWDQRIINKNDRYHIVATYDNNLMKIYVDGELIAEKEATGKIKTHSIGNLIIGDGFIGSIDEVYIYNYALSTQEIHVLHTTNLDKFDYEFQEITTDVNEHDFIDTSIVGIEIQDLSGAIHKNEINIKTDANNKRTIQEILLEQGFEQKGKTRHGNNNLKLKELNGQICAGEPIVIAGDNNDQIEIPACIKVKNKKGQKYKGTIQKPTQLSGQDINISGNFQDISHLEIYKIITIGDTDETISFTDIQGNEAKVKVTTQLDQGNIGDEIQVYYSQDDVNREHLTSSIITNTGGQKKVEFLTDHFTTFVIGGQTGSFIINNDDISTSSTNVTLNISGSNISHMRFANDSLDLDEAIRETFTENKARSLSPTNGTKTVYAQFSGLGGTRMVNDSIILNDIPLITAGEISIIGMNRQQIPFDKEYQSIPVVLATPKTDNHGNNYPIPTIRNITTSGFELAVCIDNGQTQCMDTSIEEIVSYFVVDKDQTDNYDWIEAGTIDVKTDGSTTQLGLTSAFNTAPNIRTTPQTYNQGGNISAIAWAKDTQTNTTIDLIGCVHPGIANTCEPLQPNETIGYLAIDTTNIDTSTIPNIQYGMKDISNSLWTNIIFGYGYIQPEIMVTQNDDDGGQDTQYPWARNITSIGGDIRYCEADGINDCDTHTSEKIYRFAIESYDKTTLPTANITYDIITESTPLDVTATLGNFNKNLITITNNSGNADYVFTDNGSFTFEFIDAAGNTGETTATVSWIRDVIYFTGDTPPDGYAMAKQNVSIEIGIDIGIFTGFTRSWDGLDYSLYNSGLIFMSNLDNNTDIGDTNTTVIDISNAGNNGTINGTPIRTGNGKQKGAYIFDGVDDSINIGTYNLTNFTISTRFYSSQLSNGRQTIIGDPGTSFEISQDSSNKINIYAQGLTSNTTIEANRRYHLAIAQNNAGTQLYIDGVLDNSNTNTTDINSPLSIGLGYSTQYWFGGIDDVKIYNYGLSSSDVNQLYLSNLQKINSNHRGFKTIQTGLADANYIYTGTIYEGGNKKETTRTITIDQTPFNGISVINTSPYSGEIDVFKSRDIIINFITPMNTGTFVGNIITNPALPGIEYNRSGDQQLILSHNEFEYGTTYTVSILTGLITSESAITNEPYIFSFESMPAEHLEYSSDTFNESSTNNNGSISNNIIVTLTGDVFSNSVTDAGNIVIENIPTGLIGITKRLSDSQISISLSGKADSHINSDDTSNVIITFTGNSFETLGSHHIFNNPHTLNIDFLDPYKITLGTTKDTALDGYAGYMDVNRGSAAGFYANQAEIFLLGFDLSSIPQGATIDSATLSLTMYGGTNTPTIHLRELLNNPWIEGTSNGTTVTAGEPTYNQRENGTPGSDWYGGGPGLIEGIDYSTQNLRDAGTLIIDTPVKFELNNTGLTILEKWSTNSGDNYGFAITVENNTSWSEYLATKEHTTPEYRPSLEILYTPKTTIPTASVEYNPQSGSDTPFDVTATLTGFSEAGITVTNNGGSSTYVFTENGTFTFEFQDPSGNTGTQVATVTWIDHISIGTPQGFNFTGSFEVKNHDTQVTGQLSSGEYFYINDPLGDDNGRYTTISASHLSGTRNHVITNDNLFIKSNEIITLNGQQNSGVQINNLMNNYVPLSGEIIYMYRNSASNYNKTGQYGDQPYLKLNIPAYQPPGMYSGTIIFTLYES